MGRRAALPAWAAFAILLASPACLTGQDRPVTASPAAAPTGLRVGLALSGGSAKGFAHIGVLRVLEEAGVHVDVVAGTSMGSVVGGLYALGLSPDSIESIVAAVDWPRVLSDGIERSRRFLHQKRFDERAVLTLPMEGWRVALPAGRAAGSNVLRLAEEATWPAATVRTFGDLPRPFASVATDIETGEAVTMTDGVLAEAMRASIGIPGAFEPFERESRVLVDGAMARNLPASDARALGADVVICSDVSGPVATRDELESLVDVLDQVVTLSMRASTEVQRELCDVLVAPVVDSLSGFAFDRYEDWIQRGEVAAESHRDTLRAIAARRGPGTVVRSAGLLGDSVRVTEIRVEGAVHPQTERLVRQELRVVPGSYVTAAALSYRLGDLDATGLFGIVRYRLDAADGGVALTVQVQERPRDRFGVGLRYDDERRAALLFTATRHNLVRYGSVTRFDLRVGAETRARVSYLRRHGVTGRLEGGTTASWSQGDLRLPEVGRPSTTVEIARLSTTLGLVAARTTFLGLEAAGELVNFDSGGPTDLMLFSGAAVFDHESLDDLDLPHSGVDARIRWELGGTDVAVGESFSALSADARAFLPVHARLTADVGVFLGTAWGADLPVHRRFSVGGAHRSVVFDRVQPLFHGVPTEELTGTSAQIARLGLRWQVSRGVHLRVGMDVGGALDTWRFPMRDPVMGVGVTGSVGTPIGPVAVEWAEATDGYGPRLTVSVGRWF